MEIATGYDGPDFCILIFTIIKDVNASPSPVLLVLHVRRMFHEETHILQNSCIITSEDCDQSKYDLEINPFTVC